MSKETKKKSDTKTKNKTTAKSSADNTNGEPAEPIMNQRGRILQEFGTVIHLPIGLEQDVLSEKRRTISIRFWRIR